MQLPCVCMSKPTLLYGMWKPQDYFANTGTKVVLKMVMNTSH